MCLVSAINYDDDGDDNDNSNNKNTVQHYTITNNWIAYLKVAKRADLKNSHHKERNCNYVKKL